MTGTSPWSWMMRARRGERGTRDRQLTPVVAGSRMLGEEEDTRQAARAGRGRCAHAGAGVGHVTGRSPRSWLVRARRAGGGTLDRQGAPAVVGSHTLGRGRSYLTAETPRPMPWLWPGCAHLGGRMGAGQGSVPWLWPVGARRGVRLGAGQGSAPWSWPIGARRGGWLGTGQGSAPWSWPVGARWGGRLGA